MSGSAARRGEIRSLTGLRGCAAASVMLYHFSLGFPADAQLPSVFARGYLCVDLFFVLSGFVMAYSQAHLFAGGYTARNHVAFLLTRLARIYPLYALVVLESALLLAWRTDGFDAAGLLRTLSLNLLLVQAWGLAPSLEGAAWSISTEWASYLLFPVLLGLLFKDRRRAALATVAALAALACLSGYGGEVAFPGQGRAGPLDIYSHATPLPLVRCVAEFALGLTTFRCARAAAPWLEAVGGRLALGAAVLLLAAFAYGADITAVALFGVLIFSLSPGRGPVARLLGSAVPYRLGQWSYAVYLIHDKFSHPAVTVRQWLAPRVPFASEITVLLVSAAVVLCSACAFYLVEAPLRRVLSQGARRWRLAESGTTGGSSIVSATTTTSLGNVSG